MEREQSWMLQTNGSSVKRMFSLLNMDEKLQVWRRLYSHITLTNINNSFSNDSKYGKTNRCNRACGKKYCPGGFAGGGGFECKRRDTQFLIGRAWCNYLIYFLNWSFRCYFFIILNSQSVITSFLYNFFSKEVSWTEKVSLLLFTFAYFINKFHW